MSYPPSDPPPPSYPSAGEAGAPAAKPQNIFGLLALILGIASLALFFCYGGFWAGIPAIVLGIIGLNKVKGGRATNRGMALAGTILGVLGLLASIAILALGLSVLGSDKGKELRDCLEGATTPEQQQQCRDDFEK